MEASEIIRSLRKDYETGVLEAADLRKDPIEMFREWIGEAISEGLDEPHAMTLCTASKDGYPAGRVVLLRGFDQRGFVFYTNYESAKAEDLAENQRAALVFYWHPLQRQVRVRGTVERVSREESVAYFRSRPRGHQLAAWASRQSREVGSRAELEARLQELEAQFPGEVPLPDFWGGYRLRPEQIEFWQGRVNRLHDRFTYSRAGEQWTVSRVAP